LRAPPDFREELHPEEILRRPPRHPWLATIALVVSVVGVAMLLRALDPPPRAEPPATADRPGASDRAAAPIARAAGGDGDRAAAAGRGR
jgi:hypothetical protein